MKWPPCRAVSAAEKTRRAPAQPSHSNMDLNESLIALLRSPWRAGAAWPATLVSPATPAAHTAARRSPRSGQANDQAAAPNGGSGVSSTLRGVTERDSASDSLPRHQETRSAESHLLRAVVRAAGLTYRRWL